jgi:hypothetical protein
MITRKIMTSMDKISSEVLEAVMKKYPDGWVNHVRRISKPNGDFFHGITVDLNDTSYLIKVNVKVDSRSDLEKEEEKQQAIEDAMHEEEQANAAAEPAEEPEY